MNKMEFKAAFEIANSDKDLSGVDDSPLFGCGLKGFQPVHTTLEAVAKLVRYQALYLNGNWDMAEVDNMACIARRNFIIIG